MSVLFLIVFVCLISLIPLHYFERIEALKKDYPQYVGLFKSSKFRKSFIKKVNLEEQIKALKEELSAVDLDVEFYINKAKQLEGDVE